MLATPGVAAPVLVDVVEALAVEVVAAVVFDGAVLVVDVLDVNCEGVAVVDVLVVVPKVNVVLGVAESLDGGGAGEVVVVAVVLPAVVLDVVFAVADVVAAVELGFWVVVVVLGVVVADNLNRGPGEASSCNDKGPGVFKLT